MHDRPPLTALLLQQVGVLLFILYGLQCFLGGIIHFVKSKTATRRPPQNYLHAVLGISIIGISFYQVRTGYTREWPNATGRPAPMAINVLWYVWVVVSTSFAEAILDGSGD
jgi:hypothetical protein